MKERTNMIIQSDLPITEEIKYLQSYVTNLKANILNSLDLPDSQIEEMLALEKYLELRIGNLRNLLKG